MVLEATLEPAEKSSSCHLREQGPKQRAPNSSYSSLTAELEKERAGQTSKIKCMHKVGWEALTSTPIPMASVCGTRSSVHRAISGAASHHSPLLPASADLNFTPGFLVFSTYFDSQTPHSREGNVVFPHRRQQHECYKMNLELACYHGKYIMSCNITSS